MSVLVPIPSRQEAPAILRRMAESPRELTGSELIKSLVECSKVWRGGCDGCRYRAQCLTLSDSLIDREIIPVYEGRETNVARYYQ